MSQKVKVHALAKRYGFKSSEFVALLRKLGYSVSSYQASLEEWDVPIIEERLVRGGLLDAAKATTLEPAPAPAESEDAAPAWKVVIEESKPEAEEEEPEAIAEPEEAHPAADRSAPEAPAAVGPAAEPAEVESEEPVAEEPQAQPEVLGETQTEAVVTRETEILDVPMEAAAGAETPAPVSSEPVEANLEGTESTAAAEPPARGEEPAPAEAGEPEAPAAPEAEAAAPEEAPAAKGEHRGEASTPPKPRPRRGARKVGKIDLTALGLVKQRQAQDRRSVTFTDIRDRESMRRREQRTRQREKMRQRRQGGGHTPRVTTRERKSVVVLEPPVTIKSFSVATGVKVNEVMGKLMGLGVMTTINATLEEDTVLLLAEEVGVPVRVKHEEDVEESLMAQIEASRGAADESDLEPRPPVIAFLGHVDHGKTSLIDVIRKTRVAAGEAGGITQHIGACQVKTGSGRLLTIIDTPGHEAFTAMRSRGAHTTDIVVLVVAADDGVMPQTEEAANHARAAGVPMVVAINKVDVANANPDAVRAKLAGIGLQPEEWGGDVGVVEVSALRKTGIDELLDRVLLEADLLNLRARKDGPATGIVLEALVSEGRGKVADVLIQDGTLHVGDVVLAGPTYGKIRRMFDHRGKTVKTAGPSMPVEILGLNDLPPAGERFHVVGDLNIAKEVAEKRQLAQRSEGEQAGQQRHTLHNILERMEESVLKRVRLVVKADVLGTLEVLRSSLARLSTDEVLTEIVHSGVGLVTESDVLLAETSGATVIAFNVTAERKARQSAERAGVEIRRYSVIYELLEDIQKALQGLLEPEEVEEIRGHAAVRAVFRSSRFGTIAGCMVTDGEVRRSCTVRVKRGDKVLAEGEIESLRRFKDDVRTVKEGNECGVRIRGFDGVQEGDELEFYEIVERRPSQEGAAAENEGE